jgi:hypothetical protein
MGSIFAAGLLFKTNPKPCVDEKSETGVEAPQAPQGTGNSSPFVTIFRDAEVKVVGSIVSVSHIARVLMCSIAA